VHGAAEAPEAAHGGSHDIAGTASMAAKKSSAPDIAAFRATSSSEFLRAAPAELATVTVVIEAAIISTVMTTTAMPAIHPRSLELQH
jgi:hypothetical protein